MFRDFQNVTIVRCSQKIAQYSYGIYLLHPFALMLGFDVLRGRSLGLQLGVSGVSLASAAVAVCHLIEHPFIELGKRAANLLQNRFGTTFYSPRGLDLT